MTALIYKFLYQQASFLVLRIIRRGILTFSKSMLFIATSMPLTTFVILPVTLRMVTAVCTRELTASSREPSRSKLSFSFCLRIAFWA
jgi:hypothetical protein